VPLVRCLQLKPQIPHHNANEFVKDSLSHTHAELHTDISPQKNLQSGLAERAETYHQSSPTTTQGFKVLFGIECGCADSGF